MGEHSSNEPARKGLKSRGRTDLNTSMDQTVSEDSTFHPFTKKDFGKCHATKLSASSVFPFVAG